MGQQQILLIILVSIIVGTAIIVGMLFIEKEQVQFMEDEYTQLMFEVAEQAQAWHLKPKELGGGGNSFENISFNQIPCPLDAVDPSNPANCESDEGYHLIQVQRLFPGFAIISSTIYLGSDRYYAEILAYTDKIEWSKEWEKQ